MQTKINFASIRLVFLFLFVLLFVVFLYTFLHEVGHAIVGLIFGQSLTAFDVSFWNLNAHVGMIGGALTRSQLAMQAVAGTGLPLLIWLILIILIPRKTNSLMKVLRLNSSMVVLNALLAWIVIPVLDIFGKAPTSDDVTNFLRQSQIQPILLTGTALIMYVRGACSDRYFGGYGVFDDIGSLFSC